MCAEKIMLHFKGFILGYYILHRMPFSLQVKEKVKAEKTKLYRLNTPAPSKLQTAKNMPETGGATFQSSNAIMWSMWQYLIFLFSKLLSTFRHLRYLGILAEHLYAITPRTSIPKPACKACQACRSMQCSQSPGDKGVYQHPAQESTGVYKCLAKTKEK